MQHKNLSLAGFAFFVGALAHIGSAEAQSAEDFYSGRNVTLVVSSDAGGTTGLYGRTIGEFLGRHIPGQPTVVMQLMSGGGGIRATNYCYGVAPKDGSVICEPPRVLRRPFRLSHAAMAGESCIA